ncbi:hypothetical protein [Brasilonema sp. UFV-L1]|uniref:hypothetical protein n=1 Tax=Brasilonema sp. UFV-L1 TaxID=2234130 RepID=UPI00145E94CA|nr:hypothetical protein [Brasilonema sp. UFV-L1]NMG11041.1 hypothetical protein [Brasilonema sp. UFV-L1]
MANRKQGAQKSPNFISTLLRGNRNLNATKLAASIRTNTNKVRQRLQPVVKYLINQKRFVLVLLLLLCFSLVTFSAIVPRNHIFEGSVTVQEMDFTYNGKQTKRFLESIRGISNLESEGIQTVTFTGNFKSESLPQLNQLNFLKVELTNRKSKLILAPENLKSSSEIDLKSLQLQPNTKVTELNYDFFRQQLALSLQRLSTAAPDNKSNTLEIYLGEKPIKVTLEGYKFPELNLQTPPGEQTRIEFIYNPDNKQFHLDMTQKNSLYITISKPQNFESQKWFRGKIETQNVQFQRSDRNGDIRDELDVSTIVSGKIRMAGEEKEIQKNQFLMGENPNIPLNIQLIRNIEIISKKGLEVRFSGTDKQITIGLDKDFPVIRIQRSWLDGVLPRDAIVALFSFAAATVANLVPWLLSNSSKSQSKP